MKLTKDFFQRNDVVQIAKDLLGKIICTNINGMLTRAMITETEAYRAPEDRASHAFGGKRTPRTEVMYEEGGTVYVYLIYGMYKLFNIVTNTRDVPHVVLLRSIEPLDGIEFMLKRRQLNTLKKNLCCGPGLLTIAMGIDSYHNGINLFGNTIWLEDAATLSDNKIVFSPRVGMGKNLPEPYYSMPWRFYIKGNEWISKK